ncbi:hypothetical protein V6N13_106377 [Hibiscus sabdariffa]|uniref:Uncharacterized protein n=1 Tax=Hibiscus sabdariffa TaxID=183260 RepID=A0ABR2F0H6_9ROSI
MAGISKTVSEFEDLLPTMTEKLGGDGLMRDLCNGFKLLVDKEKGVISVASLKSNNAMLGLQELRDDELLLSPELMEESQLLVEEELKTAGFLT